jgi:threonine/homoserine/homoserine lactone efflux protein
MYDALDLLSGAWAIAEHHGLISSPYGAAPQDLTKRLAIAALFLIAAITPGPNNLIVLRTAVRVGFSSAMIPVASIVAGSLALLVAIIAGLGSLISQWPQLRVLIATGGALYMIWLGLSLIRRSRKAGRDRDLSAAGFGIFAFQFLNPKGWVMMLTAVAASPAHDLLATFLFLAPVATCIPMACLLLWAALGHLLSSQLDRPAVAMWIDRFLGVLLIASVLPLLT